ASLICSAVLVFMILPSSNSSAHPSEFKFMVIVFMPKFSAAFWVLKRVLKLELKNNKPIVLCFPKFSKEKGSCFIEIASSIRLFISGISSRSKNCFIYLFQVMFYSSILFYLRNCLFSRLLSGYIIKMILHYNFGEGYPVINCIYYKIIFKAVYNPRFYIGFSCYFNSIYF